MESGREKETGLQMAESRMSSTGHLLEQNILNQAP